MASSDARIQSNRRNAALSTGPTSTIGKERSRRNGLKHGMTGAGIVLLHEDAAAVKQLNEELQAEMAPQTAYGRFLVRQMATLSVKMDRSAKQETAATASNVRHAVENFDHERLIEADRLIVLLEEDPRYHLRKLKRTPEGVERLIEVWHDLRADLTRNPDLAWTDRHSERLTNLLGYRTDDIGASEIEVVTKAIQGDLASFSEATDLADDDRKAGARALLVEQIDAEIAQLEAHYETLDFERIELDRADAPDVALFDHSPKATLARRYEADASRRFHKAYDEFRQAEGRTAGTKAPAASPKPAQKSAPLASSCERPAPVPREPQPTPAPARPVDEKAGFVPTGTMGGWVRVASGKS